MSEPDQPPSPDFLAVDLDGTLLRSDIGFEHFWSACARSWKTLPVCVAGLFRGRPWLKERLRNLAGTDVATLPYNDAVIEYVRDWRNKDGKAALVTASNAVVARAIADHLGIFDEVHGTGDRGTNLKGRHKASFLEKHTGEGGYAYMGDARADIPVWKKARKAITVNAPASLRAEAERVCSDTEHVGRSGVAPAVARRALHISTWPANLLVFLPVMWVGALPTEFLLRGALAAVAFALMASASGLAGDLLRLDADRRHAATRTGPSASGALGIAGATLLVPTLVAAAMALGSLAGPDVPLWLSLQLVGRIALSIAPRTITVLAAAALASLLHLRVLAGAGLAAIPLSAGLLMLSLLTLFPVAALVLFSANDGPGRGHGGAAMRVALPAAAAAILAPVVAAAGTLPGEAISVIGALAGGLPTLLALRAARATRAASEGGGVRAFLVSAATDRAQLAPELLIAACWWMVPLAIVAGR